MLICFVLKDSKKTFDALNFDHSNIFHFKPLDLPFSEACERNKGPILKILQNELKDTRLVLEIGFGTG